MSKCVLGPATGFGRRHSAQVCSRCGAISVFLDGKLCAAFSEDGDELQVLTCRGRRQEAPFRLKFDRAKAVRLNPDRLQRKFSLLMWIRAS